jgi:hypothetical protein
MINIIGIVLMEYNSILFIIYWWLTNNKIIINCAEIEQTMCFEGLSVYLRPYIQNGIVEYNGERIC